MKKITKSFLLLAGVLIIDGCALFLGGRVWIALERINKSVLSADNENFQQNSGIELIHVKRGLWSMQSTYRNKTIELYYESLMDNRLVYFVDNNQYEFAKQIVMDNEINITINNNMYQNYTDYEKAILLIASTSTLALYRDTSFNKNGIQNMFFKFIGEYDSHEIPGIINASWFKEKRIMINDDKIIIEG